MNNLFKVNSRQALEYIKRTAKAGLVPFLKGSPGAGKSSIYKHFADEYGLKLIDLRLSMMEPTDILGLPDFHEGKAVFKPFDVFPLESSEVPEGYNGWYLLLDEFNSASRETLAAAYRVVLDREVGMNKLHDMCFIGCAGNLEDDNAIVNDIGTALQSRLVHLELAVDHESWIEDIAIPQEFDSRIVAYLSYAPNSLMNFRPDHTDVTFASPRTWEFVSKLIKDESSLSGLTPMIVGTVGSEAGLDFVKFCEIYDNLIKVEDVAKDPLGAPVPNGAAERWATVTHIISNANKDNFSKLAKYLERFPLDFRVLTAFMIMNQKEELTATSEWGHIVSALGKRINQLQVA